MPSLLRREPGSDHRGHPIPWTGKQAIKAPPPQSPTRFSITPLISTSNWTYPLLSHCQTQGFMAAQRSCFIKQRRPAVAFHTIVWRRALCIPTSDQALCPVGISRGKAASKADKCATNVPPYAVGKGHPERHKKHRTHAVKRRRKHYEPQMRPRLV